MIKGIGVDITCNSRYSSLSDNTVRHILSPEELEEYKALRAQAACEYIASRFAAKEALAKALGTGFSGFTAHQLTVKTDSAGCPYFARSILLDRLCPDVNIFLSLSHEKEYSAAVVVLDGKN